MSAHEMHAPQLTTARDSRVGDWSSTVGLIPPAFNLIPPRSIARQGLELISNAVNKRRFSSVLNDAQIDLRAAGIPIIATEHRGAAPISSHSNLTRSQRRWLGQLALELYFAQLFRRESAILDLRPSRLGVDSSRDPVWSPRPLYLQWDRQFLQALRDVYAGFFLGDGERFSGGVSHLGLGSSGTSLLGHLGDGNQRAVRFGATNLRATLGEISALRSSQDPPLHGNFVAFGFYVASLHELLESLDLRFDVRAAFMRAYRED